MERANVDTHKTPETPFLGGHSELRVGSRMFYTRPARPDDRAYCQQLHKTNMYALISAHWGWDPNRFDDDFVLSEVRVIETGDTVCGFYRLSIVDEHLYVDDLQISEEWQGLGIEQLSSRLLMGWPTASDWTVFGSWFLPRIWHCSSTVAMGM